MRAFEEDIAAEETKQMVVQAGWGLSSWLGEQGDFWTWRVVRVSRFVGVCIA
jgi:hypothetical protein